MEGTKAGLPNFTKSVSTAAHCYICAAPGTCRDGAEEERWTRNASGITWGEKKMEDWRMTHLSCRCKRIIEDMNHR